MRVTEERKTFADDSGYELFATHRTIDVGVTTKVEIIPCHPNVGIKFDNAHDFAHFLRELENAWLPVC